MKKIMLLLATLLFILTGCGNKEEAFVDQKDEEVITVYTEAEVNELREQSLADLKNAYVAGDISEDVLLETEELFSSITYDPTLYYGYDHIALQRGYTVILAAYGYLPSEYAGMSFDEIESL